MICFSSDNDLTYMEKLAKVWLETLERLKYD